MAQRAPLLELLEDLLLVGQVEFHVERVLGIYHHRVALELRPVVDPDRRAGRLSSSLHEHPDPEPPELGPGLLGDSPLE
jgi:hypothetical protein